MSEISLKGIDILPLCKIVQIKVYQKSFEKCTDSQKINKVKKRKFTKFREYITINHKKGYK